MLMLAWILVFLAGVAIIFVLALLAALVRGLAGGGRRARRRRIGVIGWVMRLAFLATALTLLLAGTIHAIGRDGTTIAGCGISTFVNGGVDCFGFPGDWLVSAWLSLPGQLGDAANLSLVVLRALPQHIATGFSDLPVPLSVVAQGLLGPFVLLLAWIGFSMLLRDIGSSWRRRAVAVDFDDGDA